MALYNFIEILYVWGTFWKNEKQQQVWSAEPTSTNRDFTSASRSRWTRLMNPQWLSAQVAIGISQISMEIFWRKGSWFKCPSKFEALHRFENETYPVLFLSPLPFDMKQHWAALSIINHHDSSSLIIINHHYTPVNWPGNLQNDQF